MSRLSLCRLSFATKCGLLFLISLSLLFLPACQFAAGVGAPEEGKSIAGLAGIWVWESATNVNVFRIKARKDKKSYDVEYFNASGSLGKPGKNQLKVTAHAWVTKIGDTRLMTAKVVSITPDPGKLAKPFMMVKIDPSKDQVVMTPLKDSFEEFARAKTREAMETAVKKHLDNASAFETSVDMKRSTPKSVAAVLKLFE